MYIFLSQVCLGEGRVWKFFEDSPWIFSYVFLLMWQFKTLIECFLSNQFDEIKHVLFFKNWIQQKCFKLCCWYHQIYWFNPGDTVLYPGVSFGTPVLCKGLIYLYTKTIFVIHLNKQADTDIHKVFNSIILSELLKLNVWEGVDILILKIQLNSWCCFAPVFL